MKKLLNNIPVLILCGGKGLRLSEETQKTPKPLIKIDKFPILHHIIQILHRNHINGTPEISQHTIISQIEHEDRETSYSKLREFFNSDAHSKIIYKTFIKKGARRDTFRLNI